MHFSSDHGHAAGNSVAWPTRGIRPRKSLGQNFLVQERIAERIVEAAAIKDGDSVIEIGPGPGMLTRVLARQSLGRLILIELDQKLADELQRRFAREPHVTVIKTDFLRADVRSLAAGATIKVVGNLPFNVATAMLERLCEFRQSIARMVLMFQREVSERIRAQPGTRDHGALSVFTALDWRVVEHFRVAAGSFFPRPKVDAEVLVFEPNEPPPLAPREDGAFKATVRAAFSAPRKTLRNSLAAGLSLTPEVAVQALLAAGIDPALRPAMLGVEDFIRLTRALGHFTSSSQRHA